MDIQELGDQEHGDQEGIFEPIEGEDLLPAMHCKTLMVYKPFEWEA